MERDVLLEGKPWSYPGFKEKMEFYKGKGISIITVKDAVEFPEASTHAHNSYEFVFPLRTLESARVGNKRMILEQNRLIPINPEQEHGPAGRSSSCSILSVEIEKETLTELAHAIYGKSEVRFKSDNYVYDLKLRNYINGFIEESRNKQSGSEFVLQSLAVQIIVYMFRNINSNFSPGLSQRNYRANGNINKAIDYFMEYYNKEYSLEEVAKEVNLSPYYFIKIFKRQTGKTPYEFLLDVKISKACSLLKKSNYTITEICYLCGFSNSSHFSNVFKKRIGLSPSEFRKRSFRS
jgi:AraC family transcriptional regulator